MTLSCRISRSPNQEKVNLDQIAFHFVSLISPLRTQGRHSESRLIWSPSQGRSWIEKVQIVSHINSLNTAGF